MDGWEGGKKRGWGEREEEQWVGGRVNLPTSRAGNGRFPICVILHLGKPSLGGQDAHRVKPWPQCRPSLQGRCPACLRISVLHRQTLKRRGPRRRGRGGVVLALSELPLGPTHCTWGGHCAHLLWEARSLCAQRAPLPCPSQARLVHRGGARRTQWLGTSSPADPGAGAESMSPSPSLVPPLGQCQRQGHPGAPRGAEVPLMLPAERKRAQVW